MSYWLGRPILNVHSGDHGTMGSLESQKKKRQNGLNQMLIEEALPLPPGIRSRTLEGINGLRMHILEAGYGDGATSEAATQQPCVLLLHGFPELAYSWRKQMLPLARAGYHVVAPDQRGYGRTLGGDAQFEGNWQSSRLLNLVRDMLFLVQALGRTQVDAVIGHDFGSPVAAWCALTRPDVFQSVVMMSAPFAGPPDAPFGVPSPNAGALNAFQRMSSAVDDLQWLQPARQHYQWYYAGAQANHDMQHCPQGLHDFLRAYYHAKSADLKSNQPYPLGTASAENLAKLPGYYVMNSSDTMADTVAMEMPNTSDIAACEWLPDPELAVYVREYQKTGFQGGLQWYRCATDIRQFQELSLFSGMKIKVPSAYIAGKSDWGIFQAPGAFERMQAQTCNDLRLCELIDGAGHWVQQERPEEVTTLLLQFLETIALRA